MKRFYEFINENSNDNSPKQSYDDFLKEVEISIINDFGMTKQQAVVFIKQYDNILKSDWEQGFTTKEAIASTKRYGKLNK